MVDRKHLYSSSSATYEMTADGHFREWLKPICITHRNRPHIKDQARKYSLTCNLVLAFQSKACAGPYPPSLYIPLGNVDFTEPGMICSLAEAQSL